MSRLRLGVVLVVAGTAGHQIDGIRRALGDGAYGRIPSHLTLVPPVNVNEADLPAALEVVRSAGATSRPLKLELGPVTTFWPDTPVLYLAVGGDLEGLRRVRDAVFSGPLARPLTWRFVPHVTLAEDRTPDELPQLVELLRGFHAKVTIDRVHILREGDHRRWVPIADMPLASPAVIGRGGLELELQTSHLLDPKAAEFLAVAWDAYRTSCYGTLPAVEPFAVVARREHCVVGVATGESDDELRVERLVVDAATTGEGVGSHLLSRIEALGRERGCRRAVLVCRHSTGSWYADRGWSVVHELPAWTHGSDFVRMARAL